MTSLLITVGTDHHRFDRLVRWGDEFAQANPQIDVLIQYGSASPPRFARGSQLLDHSQLQTELRACDVVIVHGGPATITEARRAGHLPICVPRDDARGEHVDGHQQRFAAHLAKAGLVDVVTETVDLQAAVDRALERGRTDPSRESSIPTGVQRVGDIVDELVTARRAPETPSTTVLYIGGQGRSGSTLLERAIGQFPGMVSVGELVHLWRRGLRGNETCGCGLAFHDCPFWQAVGDEAYGGWHRIEAEGAVELRYAVDRTRYVPLMLKPEFAPFYARKHAEYVARLAHLYRAIATVAARDGKASGHPSPVIVDSSKHASYALLLAATPGVDMRILHVVRDSRAVAHAWSKRVERPEAQGIPMPTYGTTKASVMWDLQNSIMEVMGKRHPYLRVRYEDFVESPKDSLLEVLRFAGMSDDLSQLSFLDGETLDLEPSHTVAGNPMRFTTGHVTIRRDESWQQQMPERKQRIVSTLTSPLRRHYGYNGTP